MPQTLKTQVHNDNREQLRACNVRFLHQRWLAQWYMCPFFLTARLLRSRVFLTVSCLPTDCNRSIHSFAMCAFRNLALFPLLIRSRQYRKCGWYRLFLHKYARIFFHIIIFLWYSSHDTPLAIGTVSSVCILQARHSTSLKISEYPYMM